MKHLPGRSADDRFEHHRNAVRARLLRSQQYPAGPGSITWRVNREIVVVAGWGRAILLQLAHPAVASGVEDHSSFRGSLRASLRRLRSTVGAMLSLSFGDTERIIATAARINAIHDRVRGCVGHPPGRRYSAHDPELQRWVHVTLVDSILLAYERLVAPLTPSERDRYCQEAAIMEPLLGMPSGTLPRRAEELDAYMRQMLDGDGLTVTDSSRALARAVLYPPRWWAMWPAFRAVQLLTLGSLPCRIRDAYGFEWNRRDAGALARWTMVIRATLWLAAPIAREWPAARRQRSVKGRRAKGERAKAKGRRAKVEGRNSTSVTPAATREEEAQWRQLCER